MIKIKTDTRLFDTGMIKMATAAVQGTKQGMTQAMRRFKSDALNKPPSCPVKTGWLAAHHVTTVEVMGKRVRGELTVIDTPYAASLHEGISRWGTPYVYTKPGSGMKWIQSKVLMYRDKYTQDEVAGFVTGLKSVSFGRFAKGFGALGQVVSGAGAGAGAGIIGIGAVIGLGALSIAEGLIGNQQSQGNK